MIHENIINRHRKEELLKFKNHCESENIPFDSDFYIKICSSINNTKNSFFINYIRSLINELEKSLIKLEINYFDLNFKLGCVTYFDEKEDVLTMSYYHKNIHLILHLNNKNKINITDVKYARKEELSYEYVLYKSAFAYTENVLNKICLEYLESDSSLKNKIVNNILNIDNVRQSIVYIHEHRKYIIETFNSFNIDINKNIEQQLLKINDYSKLTLDTDFINLKKANTNKNNLKV